MKNDDETSPDKACNGSEIEGKNIEILPFIFSVNGSKTNSAATPSEENQKDEVLNNQFEKLNSYSAKEKKQSKYR